MHSVSLIYGLELGGGDEERPFDEQNDEIEILPNNCDTENNTVEAKEIATDNDTPSYWKHVKLKFQKLILDPKGDNVTQRNFKISRRCVGLALLSCICLIITIAVTQAGGGRENNVLSSQVNDESSPTVSPSTSNRTTSNPTTSSTTLNQPTQQPQPTKTPTAKPTEIATLVPTKTPTLEPTKGQTTPPTLAPTLSNPNLDTSEARFYVIGDVPYTTEERKLLESQVLDLKNDAEYLFHVGDLRSAQGSPKCKEKEYQQIADILKQSAAPVFVIPGDNDWNDCPNHEEGFNFWKTQFVNFEENWSLPFTVSRDSTHPENFYFIYKQVLYIGVNLVGRSIFSNDEWSDRLDYKYHWVKDLIIDHIMEGQEAASVVLVSHAFPTDDHDPFFVPLKKFNKDTLEKKIPILYVNGDKHIFEFENKYLGHANVHRLGVNAKARDPPLQISVTVPGDQSGDLNANDVFEFNRFYEL